MVNAAASSPLSVQVSVVAASLSVAAAVKTAVPPFAVKRRVGSEVTIGAASLTFVTVMATARGAVEVVPSDAVTVMS